MKTLILAASALALTLSVPPEVSAQTAARVESQTRPNFGLLLDPPSGQRSRPRTHRRWSYGDRYPGWNGAPPPVYRPNGSEEIVLVDCGGNPGTGAVEAAVHRVRPGGTLVIRARGGACVGWLNVDKPLTIIGEGGFDPRRWNENPSASLQAPDGLPCITVSAGVRLEIRDLVLASPRGGDAACIVNYGGQVIMSRAGIRHSGDEAAILSDGGLVDLRDVVIDARTIAPAIVADGATLTTWETVVTGAQSGIELTPGAGDPSRIQSTTLAGVESPNNYGPRSLGISVRSRRDYGRVEISNTKVCGYVEGVAIEGASVTIDGSKICKSDKGVVLYNGELSLTNSRVRADTVGVAIASGRAVVTDNSFVGVTAVFQQEYRAQLTASGNRVWSDSLCRPTYRPVYRDRYAPYWAQGGQGYECQRSAYPREWWDDMDGSYGDPYDDYAYSPTGYDRFQQGYGWYTGQGQYVDQPSPYGDDRWREGRRRWR
ncbi:hypothetical protein [Brevundimonas subvibrioides]|uniref:Right handed beta helix domain-containing protein n=1 Tax=Brevundimonas subvibrioides (strain ATCC 15264 / DSM 4735 / LMG 14903 / NBRC 16000 / CB 81) TaxID=633149 RepID=D9QMQ8_BRESC|nr:hypothetical protein [Brevundimonas subvibrioides]ADL02064.1 hypothetical protein Bresu_2757 [Brevundimonas subvibrioides ATCC 15264]